MTVLVLSSLPGQAQTPASAAQNNTGVLQAPPVQTTVTVSEKVLSETPASLVVLGQEQLSQTPGVNLDDRLRQVPGFSLFRRSSSLVANPTTQGVSLRATGPRERVARSCFGTASR